MTHTSGRRRREDPKHARKELTLVLLLTFGSGLLALILWIFLVRAAIDFGSQARNGESDGWFYMGVAGLGAATSMLLALIMVGRGLHALGLDPPQWLRPR